MTKPPRSDQPRVRRIGLLLNSSQAFDRALARGVGEYLHTHRGWVVFMDPMFAASEQSLRHWNLDGLIIDVNSSAMETALKLENVSIVGVGACPPSSPSALAFPVVTPDQQEIGRGAARYFLDLGFKHFAFCAGDDRIKDWCQLRQQGFCEVIDAAGHPVAIYEPGPEGTQQMPTALNSIGKWLRRLPHPTAVFAYFDGWARWVLDACVLEGLRVPVDITVLGVDDDRWLCELSQPRLSSLDPNVHMVGYTACEKLAELLRGDPAAGRSVTLIAPGNVVARESTDILPIGSPEVSFAIRYIREHACDPITPADVLKITGMSNSTAYRRFKSVLGRSIHSEIQRVQMERVQELLVTTNLNVTEIAHRAGFDNVRYLTKVFRELTSVTPTEFRRRQSTPAVERGAASR